MAGLLKKGEKLAPDRWRAELKSIEKEMDGLRLVRTKTAAYLAYAEVLGCNKGNFEREETNRARQQRQSYKNKRGGQDLSLIKRKNISRTVWCGSVAADILYGGLNGG